MFRIIILPWEVTFFSVIVYGKLWRRLACYSDHPLVVMLEAKTHKPVIRIFESGVSAALLLIRQGEKFGIVSTGKISGKLLATAVRGLLGELSPWFSGVAMTGLNANELHDAPPAEVKKRMKDATKVLIGTGPGEVKAICLGCAGMAEMEKTVREACIETLEMLGAERGLGHLCLFIASSSRRHSVYPHSVRRENPLLVHLHLNNSFLHPAKECAIERVTGSMFELRPPMSRQSFSPIYIHFRREKPKGFAHLGLHSKASKLNTKKVCVSLA